MAEKTTTLNVIVDLDCPRCYRQIRKVLCKLQATADQERIRTISYNDNSHTISITGPFDPLQLCCKIRCMGGKVIRDIQIKQPKPPPPPPPPPCTCKRDIEQLNLRMTDIQRQQNICVDQNQDIEQLKQQMVDLQGHQQSCVEMKRDIKQLELNMVQLQEQFNTRRSSDEMMHIPSSTPCYSGCRCNRVHIYAAAGLAGCHGGAPYCGCYRGCQFSEDGVSTGCSVM
ncbi:uncharacterized protein LOC133892707 [Phragmites australis]|uniref:uncharacterized protein LOC133892707 n=1 Tax=Phragmites australis TaxID=29695 RepID=UPI002D792EE9|nr:uncharacterized protein LOC133892707 [Phragmites australis]